MASAGGDLRPIVIRRIKKAAHAHHGGAWKVAYADFVTAMMAFFMLLWLISNPDKQRLKGLAEYFSPAPPTGAGTAAGASLSGEAKGVGGRNRPEQAGTIPATGQPAAEATTAGVARGGTAAVPDASLRVLAQELRVALDSVPEPNTAPPPRVESDPGKLRISLTDTDKRSMFVAGTATLNPYARELLARIAARLVRSGVGIAIEGHTDAAGGQAGSNWRLSGERALAAREAMLAAGLTPDRITAVIAKGASQPVYPDQPERPENRRITVVLSAETPALPTDASFKF